MSDRVPSVSPSPPPSGGRAATEAFAVILMVAVPPLLARELGLFSTLFGVAMATLLLRLSGQSWSSLGLTARPRWFQVLWQGGLLYLASTALVGVLLMPALDRLGLGAPDVSAFSGIEGNTQAWLTLLIFSWIFAAFGEEMIARGFLLDRFSRILGPGQGSLGAGVFLQAGLFGLAHAYQGPAGILLTFVLGLILAIGYLVTGRNLWVAVMAHGITNTVSLTGVYLGLTPI